MSNINPLADVKSEHIGEGTKIWQFCVVLPDAVIGKNCNICSHVLIENEVVIGDNVTIKCGVQVWDGIQIGNNVFIGPNVTFTNDLIPRSKKDYIRRNTVIEEGASIGANATIIAGHTVGAYAFIGAGSVVTKDIPANTVWYGNPARQKGYITNKGILLGMDKKDKEGKLYEL
ncbi:acyltransferase [uncultured Odoribacter sp.]|uniref:acyltransferase n=1 Tax=uncultured Odoribacter sp. TaxID=876416 RepID=UPI00261860C9|nr:acyltransferase [uncultured Odoribacter sp.]